MDLSIKSFASSAVVASLALTGLAVADARPLGASKAHYSRAPRAKYRCTGSEMVIFDNSNGDLVENGGTPPTFSTRGRAYCVTYIQTYHWDFGANPGPAGQVGLKARAGSVGGGSTGGPGWVGSWQATGTPGQATTQYPAGVPNVNWRANLPHQPPVVIDGSYSCRDSAPGTWSQNRGSGGLGFCIVGATRAVRVR